MPVTKCIAKSATAFITLFTLTTATLHADVAFTESDFDFDSYAIGPTISLSPQDPESTFNVTSSRFTSQEQGNFILQQFNLNFAPGNFTVITQPILMNDFVYDPQTEGAIESLFASMKIFPVANNLPVTVGQATLFIGQNDTLYRAVIDSYFTNAGATTYSNSNLIETNFLEINDQGLVLDSHPDFDGELMQFAFATAMTKTGLAASQDHLLMSAFDDLVIRIDSAPVPEPASLSFLSLGALALLRRKRQ
ncbi:PEP-CTERM sorting domain-containing protein [Poriferisphaera sp. WC338]|uniref:PEP-CTERM sorting domain-containing protein n=1 Tax=Poriferisphaera sp. WC338 TaxID=3425129 RepID=UPI003D819AF3